MATESAKPNPDYQEQTSKIQLFFAKVPFECTEEELKAYFESCGPVESMLLMKKAPNSQQHKGFGFLKMQTVEAINSVLSVMHTVKGTEIVVRKANPKKVKYFVGGLEKGSTTEALFKAAFEPYGKLEEVKLFAHRIWIRHYF